MFSGSAAELKNMGTYYRFSAPMIFVGKEFPKKSYKCLTALPQNKKTWVNITGAEHRLYL